MESQVKTLKQIRLDNDLSQQKLADIWGKSLSAIQSYESKSEKRFRNVSYNEIQNLMIKIEDEKWKTKSNK
jgi:transcriptional regulator with XRE-family HTH domain